MEIPQELKYTKDHEWVRIEGDTVVIDVERGELNVELSAEEMRWFLCEYVADKISEHQAAALVTWVLRRGESPAAALAGLLAFQVNGITQVNFWDGKSQHTLMIWAGVVLSQLKRKQMKTGRRLSRKNYWKSPGADG